MSSAYMDYTDWKERERAADRLNARELGQLMLWAMWKGVPAAAKDELDHFEIVYPHIEAVVYTPNRHTPSVRLRDGKAKGSLVTVSSRKVTLLTNRPGDLSGVRAAVDLTDGRKKELFDTMRNGYAVESGGEKYRRIQAILFRLDPESGGIVVTLELVRAEDCGICEQPQELVGLTGRYWNR